jgi:hypothetical protein
MEGPSPVSALLHSATMAAAGAYLLLRMNPLLAASGWGRPVTAWAGAVTALALGLVAVAQADLKQLLAASTCAQVGFMVLAAGAGGLSGGVMQLVAHAATKSLLFLAAGAWLAALGTKQLPALRGAARRYPLVGVTFTIGAAVLAGLPPGSLWVAKDQVLAAALHDSMALYGVGLAAAVVSAVPPGCARHAAAAVCPGNPGRGPRRARIAGRGRSAGPGARRHGRAVARLVGAGRERGGRAAGQRGDLVVGCPSCARSGDGPRLAHRMAVPRAGRPRADRGPHRAAGPRAGGL